MKKYALALLLLVAGVAALGYHWQSAKPATEEGSQSESANRRAGASTAAASKEAGMSLKKPDALSHFSTAEEFHVFAKSTLQGLPRMADFKKLKAEDVHETPLLIRKAGADLGSIAEAVSEDARLAPEAFHFYEECSANGDLPGSIRALCYVHYLHWGTELKETLNAAIVSEDIKALAKKL